MSGDSDMCDVEDAIESHGLNGTNGWPSGVNTEWPTPPPTINPAKKRAWDEVTTPTTNNEVAQWNGVVRLDNYATSSAGFYTPAVSQNTNGSFAGVAKEEVVEEIPRTKMQTGCIPCL